MIRARCPLCVKHVSTFMHHRRRIFEHHYATGTTRAAVVCDASGWLVEDDEVIDNGRQTRIDAGRARKAVR